MTKDTAKNEVYEVKAGDTLSVIANSNGLRVAEVLALNEGMSENTVLHEGDEVIITVPEPELSVETVEEATYQEEYYADVQYIDNDEWYTTKSEVRQEEQPGYHEVTALITKKNGVEENRDVISETVLQDPVPKIVERGTQTPPTYIKPISGRTLHLRLQETVGPDAQGRGLGVPHRHSGYGLLRRYRRPGRLVQRLRQLYYHPSSGRQADPLRPPEQDPGILRPEGNPGPEDCAERQYRTKHGTPCTL